MWDVFWHPWHHHFCLLLHNLLQRSPWGPWLLSPILSVWRYSPHSWMQGHSSPRSHSHHLEPDDWRLGPGRQPDKDSGCLFSILWPAQKSQFRIQSDQRFARSMLLLAKKAHKWVVEWGRHKEPSSFNGTWTTFSSSWFSAVVTINSISNLLQPSIWSPTKFAMSLQTRSMAWDPWRSLIWGTTTSQPSPIRPLSTWSRWVPFGLKKVPLMPFLVK